jgi:hypothetical protein
MICQERADPCACGSGEAQVSDNVDKAVHIEVIEEPQYVK